MMENDWRLTTWALITASLMGLILCGVDAMGQTTAERKANLKAFIDARNDQQTLDVENALVPLGYTKLSEPSPTPPPTPAERTIFSTTHETGPNQLGGWEKYERAVYNSGTASVAVVELANAKSGRYVLREMASGSSGARCFALNDWSSGTRKPMPLKTNVTLYAYMPIRPAGQWLLLCGWKQVNANRTYNEPTVTCEFGPDMTYLRTNLKGATPTPAGTPPNNMIIAQPTASRVAFPIGRWVRIDLQVRHSTGSDGYARILQDGVKLIDYKGKTMRTGADKVEFELTCYGGSLGNNTTLYYDDVTITEPQ